MLDKLLGGALQGMLGGQQGSNPLLQIAASMLSNNSQFGGLAGLAQKFQQAGLGQQMNSWVGTGQNMPLSLDQLTQVFGQNQLQQMAQNAGMNQQQFGGQLAELLPQMIDKLTPQGQVPQGGLDDALGALSKLMH